jgi:hypothetical protein
MAQEGMNENSDRFVKKTSRLLPRIADGVSIGGDIRGNAAAGCQRPAIADRFLRFG